MTVSSRSDVVTISGIKEIEVEGRLLLSVWYCRILSVSVSFSDLSQSFGQCKCPLIPGSGILTKRSWTMSWREIQHKKHRTRHIREVTSQFDVLTSLTPVPNNLLCFHFVGCPKEVRNLINRPVVKLLLFVCCLLEGIKWEVKGRPLYECRCDDRLKTKPGRSTSLGYTGFRGELEHLKIETRLSDDKGLVA